MAKQVESEVVENKDVTALSFFECQNLALEISAMAEANNGVLTEEQVNQLVEIQTQSPAKLKVFCNFLKLMEAKIQICKDRKKEINEVQKHAEGVIERMEERLAEFVDAQGKSYHAGEYDLKSRRSKSVELVEGFDNPMFCSVEMVRVVKPDKDIIKEALLAGEEVPGATLVEKCNLTIK
jgi:hypothetical protein